MREYYRLIPMTVALANGIFVAATVYFHQHDYPLRLLGVQVFIVLAALVLASKNRWIRGIGFFLTLIGIFCTFSALFLYIPTFIAAVWTLDAVQKRETSLSRFERAGDLGVQPR